MDIYWNKNKIGQTNLYNNFKIDFDNSLNVNDETRGYLIYKNGIWNFIGVAQYQGKQFEKIALILESPHKDEYSSKYVPLRPANGRTGAKINSKLTGAINIRHIKDIAPLSATLNPSVDYEIYIMNPIQVQASCYHEFHGLGQNKILNGLKISRQNTDQVFRCLFSASKGNLRQNFIDRINTYKPDYIYNCCTCTLKAVVDNAIKQSSYYNNNKNNLYHNIHPAIW